MTGRGRRERERLVALLGRAEDMGRGIELWWRDDDAEDASPELDLLLGLARRHDLPLALAVVPRDATPALADRVAAFERVEVLQHGWAHANHSPERQKKMELGPHRPLDVVLNELAEGRDRLTTLFPSRFRPVLVPPWNRVSESVAAERRSVGLIGLSTFGRQSRDDPHRVNAHVDLFAWKPTRRLLSPEEVCALLCDEIERRIGGDPEPVGILTHHRIHDEAAWTLLDEMLGTLKASPAIEWPAIGKLFRLP